MYGARPPHGETGGNRECQLLCPVHTLARRMKEHTSFGRNGYATYTGIPYAMLSLTWAGSNRTSSLGPHVRFRRVQTLVREGSPLVKLRILLRAIGAAGFQNLSPLACKNPEAQVLAPVGRFVRAGKRFRHYFVGVRPHGMDGPEAARRVGTKTSRSLGERADA